MEDFEVRQALALIKERVSKIKEEPNWKEKMADEWNQANKAAPKDGDTKSHNSYSKPRFCLCNSNLGSAATGVSQKSYMKRMAEAKKAEDKADWDNGSLTSEARNKRAEDRMASKIAAEVLKDNQKLRGIHSKESIKKILEKEALKQMQIPTEYPQPVVARTIERERIDRSDPSNLPYLHKNPAV